VDSFGKKSQGGTSFAWRAETITITAGAEVDVGLKQAEQVANLKRVESADDEVSNGSGGELDTCVSCVNFLSPKSDIGDSMC